MSKASSSIRRSPSKKHGYQSSNPLPSLDQVFYETQKSGSSETHPLPQKRPDVYRTQTAPLALQTTKSTLKEGKTPQSAGEGTMLVASFASNHRRDAPGTLSKGAGAGAGPQNGEHVQISAAVGDASYPAPAYVAGNQTSDTLYQHIHEMASKRMSTLDYFRKAYA